ncbi:putative sensory transducer protein YfmS [Lysinibacillus sphaericus]|uniref:Putative sensory transducer protein YfmS n=1 Tax=Lysinibacillus sphaericus TaxID=1421 RepID=A0A2S5CY01_LYSSH|nr:methyl-accepting chemotaxis protein [Lysinibacillus sphaericus]POZ55666.1 putative sensory transducer protein YfmS [Lysinibacillus sphaericus]
MNILEALSLSVPYIHLALKEEAIVAVIDKETETVVKCLAGKRIDVGYQDGHKVNSNDENIYTALKGQNSDTIIPEDVYGIFIYAFAFPIREHGKVVGALAFGLPIDNKLKLEEYMNKMETIINSLQDKVHNVASHSEELAATSDEINTQAQHALDDAKKTHEVTNLIKSISRQTNLLGLNASIEAARAGQHGAGFNIVAQEVRKLSSETSNATESIETSLRNINSSLENLKQNMGQINGATNEQAQLVQDFSEIIGELTVLSSKMKVFMQEALK